MAEHLQFILNEQDPMVHGGPPASVGLAGWTFATCRFGPIGRGRSQATAGPPQGRPGDAANWL